MNEQVINNLAVEIANLHIKLATEQAENTQLKQQLAQAQSENEDK